MLCLLCVSLHQQHHHHDFPSTMNDVVVYAGREDNKVVVCDIESGEKSHCAITSRYIGRPSVSLDASTIAVGPTATITFNLLI